MNQRDSNPQGRFVLCIQAEEDDVDLQAGKLYEILPDPDAERHDQIRVIDDSGEDYLYPRSWFWAMQLPPDVEDVVRRAR